MDARGPPAYLRVVRGKSDQERYNMLNKTKIALAAALVMGTASTALAAGYLEPGSIYSAPMGDPNAFPPCFDAAGQWYWPASNACYPTPGNAYGFVPSTTHHKHHSPR
jgi:hypothetical protein